MNANNLAVCTIVENPLRWKSRYYNYNLFKQMVERSGAKLYTAEIAYGNRDWVVTSPNNYQHLQLRTNCEIWHKESALNLLFQRVVEDKIAWIDADVMFSREDWAMETVELLEHYDFLQLFSHFIPLGSDHHPSELGCDGYIYKWKTTGIIPTKNLRIGYAWAARKESLSKLGMLIDWAIIGIADYHMAASLLGCLPHSFYGMKGEEYISKCEHWSELAAKHIKQNVGYLPGILMHHWHGFIKNRKYHSKLKLLSDADYIPSLDLQRDWQGLYNLTDRNLALRQCVSSYLRQRDDDGLETNRVIP